VFLSTRIPSFASSIAIRRRLQQGFSIAIRMISSTTSGSIGRRPTCLDFHAQNRAKPRRCHPATVAGLTIVSVSAHLDHVRESDPESAIHSDEPGTLRLPAQDSQLLPQSEGLHNKARPRSKRSAERADDRDQELEHGPRLLDRVRIVSRESAPSSR
jgi:hypothetical protein